MNRPIKPWMVAAALAVLAGTRGDAKEPPNILFIAIDDLKPWLGCYDHPVVQTPNIDRIAEMGTVFRRNYCQVALCGPTRASLMTGLRPDTTRIYSMGKGWEAMQLDTARKRVPHLRTLPEHYKANGYTSLGFGKVLDDRNTDKGQDIRSWSNPEGVRWHFDTKLYPTVPIGGGYQNPETRRIVQAALEEMDRRGLTRKPQRTAFMSTVEGARPVCEGEDLPDEAYAEGNVMAAPAVKAIRRFGKKRKPFFLAVGFYKPHLPFVAPKKYWDLYSPDQFALAPMVDYPRDGVLYAETPYIEGRGFHPVPDEGPIPEALQRHMMHGYAACVSYVDAQVGKLLQALEKADLMDDTVLCVWGDHGFHLGDKQIWGKHTNFEQATRSPLIIASPAIPGGRVEDEVLTEFIDVFPTLCELTGLAPPPGLEGTSLVGLMRGERPAVNRAAVSQYMRDADDGGVMGWALRDARYRYVEWRRITSDGTDFALTGEVVGHELYDYDTDPHEGRNLAMAPEYIEVRNRMVRLFDETLPHLPPRTAPDSP